MQAAANANVAAAATQRNSPPGPNPLDVLDPRVPHPLYRRAAVDVDRRLALARSIQRAGVARWLAQRRRVTAVQNNRYMEYLMTTDVDVPQTLHGIIASMSIITVTSPAAA